MLINRRSESNITGTNPYYNYAVLPYHTAEKTNEKQSIVTGCVFGLGVGGGMLGTDNTYRGRLYQELGPEYECIYFVARTHVKGVAEAIQPILARLDDSMTDRQKAEICIQAVVDRIDYEVGGGAAWYNDNPTGDCTDYAGMVWQILSSAGIPAKRVSGDTKHGPHEWVQAKLDGQWYAIDGTMAETGFSNGGIVSFAEYERIWENPGANDWAYYKVARALIDAAYPG